jgi:hypothetical protein
MNWNFERFELIAIYSPYPLFSHQYALPQYCGGSLPLKIINRVYFVMQSPHFHNFRRRHGRYNYYKAEILYICHCVTRKKH